MGAGVGGIVVVVVVVVVLTGSGGGLAGYALCSSEYRWLEDGAMLTSAQPATRSSSSWRSIEYATPSRTRGLAVTSPDVANSSSRNVVEMLTSLFTCGIALTASKKPGS